VTHSLRRTLASATIVVAALASALAGAVPAQATTTAPVLVAGAPTNPLAFTEYNGLLYFAAIAEGDAYSSLFSYDGSTFTSIPGSPQGVNALVVYNGELIVTAVDDINNPPFDSVMFSYDGSTFTQIPGGFVSPNDYVEAGGVLFFQADVSGSWGVWQFDGTTTSPVSGAAGVSPSYLSEYNGILYFNGDADPTPGEAYTLFSYDPAGVSPAAAVTGAPAEPSELVAFDGLAYFGTDSGIYSFDGVSTFTAINTAPAVSVGALTVFDGALYFSGSDGVDSTTYVYSGGVTTVVPGGIPTETVRYVEFDGALYFLGFDDSVPAVCFIQSGTASCMHGSPQYAFYFTVFQGKLYFTADVPDEDRGGMYVITAAALASTGTDVLAPGLLALALLAIGATTLVATRARRA
jgi:hypothetical protein